jgi:hypothetical protein
MIFFPFHVATTPSGPGSPHYLGFTMTDTPHSVGLLWTNDQTVGETSDNTQHSQETAIQAPAGFRTRNPSKRAAAEPRLRLRGHRDRKSYD